MAIRYHPDKNPDNKAEAKFKEAAEAYDVLCNPRQKQLRSIWTCVHGH